VHEVTTPELVQHVVWPVAGKRWHGGFGDPDSAAFKSSKQASISASMLGASPWVMQTPAPALDSAFANAFVKLSSHLGTVTK
jgi:hypothetical protein